VGRITVKGAVTTYSKNLVSTADPRHITAGPDGRFWFAEYGGNALGAVTTKGVITNYTEGISKTANPDGITLGPDNNIWFTELAGRIGKAILH
jgi:virginiamycin B lyase